MGYVNGKWMVIENYTKLSLMRNISGLFINVLLNIVLIPKLGITGAAISTVISVAFASNFSFYSIIKLEKYFIYRTSLFFI